MPTDPSGSTIISNQNGGTNNRLSWGRTDSCLGCTSLVTVPIPQSVPEPGTIIALSALGIYSVFRILRK
jgi:hypothetical protein